MTPTTRMSWIPRALLAGLVGGTVVELYLFAVGLATWPGVYQWIASTLVGPVAFTSAAYAWLGLVQHGLVSLGWALAYGFLARRRPALATRPVAAGLGFGLAVFLAMQILVAALGVWAPPGAAEVAHTVVAHTLFFGVPVALVALPHRRGRHGLLLTT